MLTWQERMKILGGTKFACQLTLKQEDYPGLSRRPKITRALQSRVGGRREESAEEYVTMGEKQRDAVLLALKMDEGAMSQRMWTASRSQRGYGIDFPLEQPERNIALLTPRF